MEAVTGPILLTKDGVSCTFRSRDGSLESVACGETVFRLNGLFVDVGIDGAFALGLLDYHALDRLQTWELPPIAPSRSGPGAIAFLGCADEEGALSMRYGYGELIVAVHYRIVGGTVEIHADIKNDANRRRLINGVAFVVEHAVQAGDACTLEFPGNVPHRVFAADELQEDGRVVQTGLVNPLIHGRAAGSPYNVLFIDEEEKWSTGVYGGGDSLVYTNLAGVECEIDPGATVGCGTLYIQLPARESADLAVRDLYRRKGWMPPRDGIREGVLYSGHPHGTMDSGFRDGLTMGEYAARLPGLKAIGIDHVWVLPIFEHLDRGVYHPTDQSLIDRRYGSDDDVRAFSRKAHELGMTLLFDYVPHGPEANDPLGIAQRDWAAVDREGRPVIEWNCLSLDMANPDYQAYIRALVQDHIDRFDIDGSRIDCAMGGLSNWKPYPGNRPSSSNLKGGAAISRTIREAFVDKGKRPLVTPENFNPVPVYAPYTDVFYDMALYRVLYELEEEALPPETYARRLTHWLDAEQRFTPEGYVKLRFLGNHDTVSWVWHKRRAVELYGVEKAQALWVLLSLIDGIPMLYQGDEDPALCRRTGPDLREFFTGLFAARRQWLSNDYDVGYRETGLPVVAFTRRNAGACRLVAVNLSPEAQTLRVEEGEPVLLYGTGRLAGDSVVLHGYGYALIDLAGAGHPAEPGLTTNARSGIDL